MFRFFDYIFYSVYKAYVSWGEKDIPAVYAVGVLSVFQFSLLFSICAIVNEIVHDDFIRVGKLFIIILGSIIILINSLRIYSVGKENLIAYWDEKDAGEKRKMKIGMYLAFLFVIFLTVLAVVL